MNGENEVRALKGLRETILSGQHPVFPSPRSRENSNPSFGSERLPETDETEERPRSANGVLERHLLADVTHDIEDNKAQQAKMNNEVMSGVDKNVDEERSLEQDVDGHGESLNLVSKRHLDDFGEKREMAKAAKRARKEAKSLDEETAKVSNVKQEPTTEVEEVISSDLTPIDSSPNLIAIDQTPIEVGEAPSEVPTGTDPTVAVTVESTDSKPTVESTTSVKIDVAQPKPKVKGLDPRAAPSRWAVQPPRRNNNNNNHNNNHRNNNYNNKSRPSRGNNRSISRSRSRSPPPPSSRSEGGSSNYREQDSYQVGFRPPYDPQYPPDPRRPNPQHYPPPPPGMYDERRGPYLPVPSDPHGYAQTQPYPMHPDPYAYPGFYAHPDGRFQQLDPYARQPEYRGPPVPYPPHPAYEYRADSYGPPPPSFDDRRHPPQQALRDDRRGPPPPFDTRGGEPFNDRGGEPYNDRGFDERRMMPMNDRRSSNFEVDRRGGPPPAGFDDRRGPMEDRRAVPAHLVENYDRRFEFDGRPPPQSFDMDSRRGFDHRGPPPPPSFDDRAPPRDNRNTQSRERRTY